MTLLELELLFTEVMAIANSWKIDFLFAGAGSCLEVLGARKPLLVVINDDLMHNHQLELAQKLHKDGHLFYTTCRLIPLLSYCFSYASNQQ